jgi:hypothetical protein
MTRVTRLSPLSKRKSGRSSQISIWVLASLQTTANARSPAEVTLEKLEDAGAA